LAPSWGYDERTGRRVVESKEQIKDKMGRSPDDADALLLAYHEGATFERPTPIDNPPRRHPLAGPWPGSAQERLRARFEGRRGRR
jgi:hypothetical protein